MTDLFPIEPSPSPRLLWIARHGIVVGKHPMGNAYSAILADEEHQHMTAAEILEAHGHYYALCHGVASGPTEEDALVDLAKRAGIKLWNEE